MTNERKVWTGVRSVHGVLSDLRMFDKPSEVRETEFFVSYVPELHFGDTDARGEDVRFGLRVVYKDGTEQVHWFDHMDKPDFGRYRKAVISETNEEQVVQVAQAEPPSDKQMKYAESIARRLHLHLPEFCSKKSIAKFISEHVDDFKEEIASDYDEANDDYDDYQRYHNEF